jgi:hypothetical protein
MADLPIQFCVKTNFRGREGFALFRWSVGSLDPQGNRVHIIKPANTHDYFYNIVRYTPTSMRFNKVISKKNNGNITREMKWAFTMERLEHDGDRIPVLYIQRRNEVLSSFKSQSFAPITVPTVPPVAPVAPTLEKKKYAISSIPKHMIEAVLRDASTRGEVCPITYEPIGMTSSAITSCFHVFDRESIDKWIKNPANGDKCPVCKSQCNVYAL